MVTKKYIYFSFLLLAVQFTFGQSRTIIDFNNDWKFYLGNDSNAINPGYDDTKWRTLNVPHDWSIESDFSKSYPATNQGGALPGGIGWYRKSFTLPGSVKNKEVSVEFDGVYRNSEVWINGHYLGKRPNGYISFYYDLTPYIKQAPGKNILVVKVDNSQQPNSRWYSGSGIYRNVKLLINPLTRINERNVHALSGRYDNNLTVVEVNGFIKTEVTQRAAFKTRITIYSQSGDKIASGIMNTMSYNKAGVFDNRFILAKPEFWSVDRPYMYSAVVELISEGGQILDTFKTRFGVRYYDFNAEKGFSLNGKPLKLKGVCMHHDLGALGAAFNKAAARRQLRILKEMGCNAIRTAHNPPASEFLDLCDEMGFLVIVEAFDMWQKRKNRYDYHLDFKEWYEKDLESMVLRDRNHPSVFMWSIGNEIREQFDSTGIDLTRKLIMAVKKNDYTRPVINALTENFPEKNFIYQSRFLEVLGFNYKLYDYKDLPVRFPKEKIIATETASALATRGVYNQPSDSMRIWPPDSKQPFVNGNPDMTVSAYDNTYAYWGATHEKAWQAVKKYDFIAGCFVWCGFDFLGEPVPYPWPARSSYYGIIDLAGFPKDVYYMYQSEWTDKPVLHLFPHWNPPTGQAGWKPGEMVDVWAYYNNADEVELFLNNKSLGVRKKLNDDLHIMWRVNFVPGTLKAVSRKNGKIVLTKEIKTAGKPEKIRIIADRQTIKADGKDLSFITATITDKDGNMVPDAGNLLSFSIQGTGFIAGTDNGFQADTVSLKSNKRACWKGMAMAIIQSSGKKGNITVMATAKGLQTGIITLKTSN
jgi:beta-galactosidase